MTFQDARKELRQIGMRLNKADGEFRVSHLADAGDGEAAAYYTDYLSDAVATGRAMAKERNATQQPQFTDTCIEHAYGTTYRLPFQVRVF